MSVRRIAEEDVEAVVELVHELAGYEKAADRCHLTGEALHTALVCEVPALFGHVAEAGDEVVGFTLWFRNFSTWDGVHGVYLEDLFVRPGHRGGGHGRVLLAELAAECVRQGYTRLQWWVLDWNAQHSVSTARSGRSRWTSGRSCGCPARRSRDWPLLVLPVS